MAPVLDLGSHPLCDDLIRIGSHEQCEEFRIEIAFCSNCKTAHQMHSVPKRRLFPSSYHYRSAMTEDVINGMRGLVAELKSQFGDLSGKTVLDVGCNDGSLLKIFRSEGAETCGVEPTAAALEAERAGLMVYNEYFDPECARNIVEKIGYPDFVTFTNVFAHIENLDELLAAMTELMGPNTRLVVENHYLGAVLKRYQFDTFYHEHPRTYSLTSFLKIAERLGRFVELWQFPSRYGGNIRVVIGPHSSTQSGGEQLLAEEQKFNNMFSDLRGVISRWQQGKPELVKAVRCGDGKIYGKAFPGRAAILIKLLKLDENEIGAVFEKPNSQKIGNYVPGTLIPILSDDEILLRIPPPRRILNLAWHIEKEIKGYLHSMDPEMKCIDIFSDSVYRVGDS